MEPKPDKVNYIKNSSVLRWLVVVGLSLLAGGFLLLMAREAPNNQASWMGMLLLGVAVISLVRARQAAARVDNGRASVLIRWKSSRLGDNGRYLFLLLAILAISYVLFKIPQLLPSDSYHWVTLGWLAAIFCYSLFVVNTDWRWPDWSAWWEAHRRTIIGVGILTVVAFFLRVWRVDSIPYTLGGDEASQGLEAIRVLTGQLRNPFSTGWLGVPTMSFFFNSVTIAALGPTAVALRLPWVFVGAGTVIVTFFLVRRLTNNTMGVVTAVILATYHYHIHFSRLGSNQIADPFFLSLALLFLYRGLDNRRRLDWALAGMTGGLALYFYAGARLTLVIITAVLVYLLLRQRIDFWRRHKQGILVLLGGFFIVAAPMLQYANQHPNEVSARVNQVGIIQSGWLAREVGIRGESHWLILGDQFQRAALAFNLYPDRTVWYGLREPLLSPLFGVLFLLGMGYALWRLFGPQPNLRLAPMVAWWWGGMLLGGMLTESPPSSQRLITLAVPVCFFIALALCELADLLYEAVPLILPRIVLGLGVGLFALGSLQTYFIEYTPQRIYGGSHAELATAVAPRLQTLQYDHNIYFVGAPWMYWGFATLPYLVPEANAVDLLEPLDTSWPVDAVTETHGAVFVFIPLRQEELGTVVATYPDGMRESFYSDGTGQLLGLLYVVPPEP